jgi:hypothetical protein
MKEIGKEMACTSSTIDKESTHITWAKHRLLHLRVSVLLKTGGSELDVKYIDRTFFCAAKLYLVIRFDTGKDRTEKNEVG